MGVRMQDARVEDTLGFVDQGSKEAPLERDLLHNVLKKTRVPIKEKISELENNISTVAKLSSEQGTKLPWVNGRNEYSFNPAIISDIFITSLRVPVAPRDKYSESQFPVADFDSAWTSIITEEMNANGLRSIEEQQRVIRLKGHMFDEIPVHSNKSSKKVCVLPRSKPGWDSYAAVGKAAAAKAAISSSVAIDIDYDLDLSGSFTDMSCSNSDYYDDFVWSAARKYSSADDSVEILSTDDSFLQESPMTKNVLDKIPYVDNTSKSSTIPQTKTMSGYFKLSNFDFRRKLKTSNGVVPPVQSSESPVLSKRLSSRGSSNKPKNKVLKSIQKRLFWAKSNKNVKEGSRSRLNEINEKPDVIDINEKPDLIDINEKPDLIDVNEKPDLIDVNEKPDLIDINDKPDLIDVNEKPDLIDINEKPDLIDINDKPDTLQNKLCVALAANDVYSEQQSKKRPFFQKLFPRNWDKNASATSLIPEKSYEKTADMLFSTREPNDYCFEVSMEDVVNGTVTTVPNFLSFWDSNRPESALVTKKKPRRKFSASDTLSTYFPKKSKSSLSKDSMPNEICPVSNAELVDRSSIYVHEGISKAVFASHKNHQNRDLKLGKLKHYAEDSFNSSFGSAKMEVVHECSQEDGSNNYTNSGLTKTLSNGSECSSCGGVSSIHESCLDSSFIYKTDSGNFSELSQTLFYDVSVEEDDVGDA